MLGIKLHKMLNKLQLLHCIILFKLNTNGRILKVNFSWSPTRAKLCQFIASLSVDLSQLNLIKFKLEYIKSGFRCKKGRCKNRRNLFCITRDRLSSSSAQVCFQNTAVKISFKKYKNKNINNKCKIISKNKRP